MGSLCLLLASASGAGAQSVGLGPRLSFVRADIHTEDSTRVWGGVLRLRTSPKTAFEVTFDYRSHLNENRTERIKDYPIQGSLLLYPVRTVVSPYLVGGFGWYSKNVDTLQDDQVIASTTTRKTGSHAGLGIEVSVGRHATIHADYRYTLIGFGDDADTAPAAVPIPGLRWLQDRLGLSHKGSMWTTGVTLYF
jgi:opacity protein-like surface antigen